MINPCVTSSSAKDFGVSLRVNSQVSCLFMLSSIRSSSVICHTSQPSSSPVLQRQLLTEQDQLRSPMKLYQDFSKNVLHDNTHPNFKQPYLGNVSFNPLRVWFYSRVFEGHGSNGTISSFIKMKMVAAIGHYTSLERSETFHKGW